MSANAEILISAAETAIEAASLSVSLASDQPNECSEWPADQRHFVSWYIAALERELTNDLHRDTRDKILGVIERLRIVLVELEEVISQQARMGRGTSV